MSEKIDSIDFQALKLKLEKFADDRNWQKFHNPKNICLAMFKEIGELAEIFQWLTVEEANSIKNNPTQKQYAADEIADVLLYLVRLATILDININAAVQTKIEKNALKYPKKVI
jgi:NTP pyrophosphatase (non-canonical NTP hydrolase)